MAPGLPLLPLIHPAVIPSPSPEQSLFESPHPVNGSGGGPSPHTWGSWDSACSSRCLLPHPCSLGQVATSQTPSAGVLHEQSPDLGSVDTLSSPTSSEGQGSLMQNLELPGRSLSSGILAAASRQSHGSLSHSCEGPQRNVGAFSGFLPP